MYLYFLERDQGDYSYSITTNYKQWKLWAVILTSNHPFSCGVVLMSIWHWTNLLKIGSPKNAPSWEAKNPHHDHPPIAFSCFCDQVDGPMEFTKVKFWTKVSLSFHIWFRVPKVSWNSPLHASMSGSTPMIGIGRWDLTKNMSGVN